MSTEPKSETHVRGTNLQAQNDINLNIGGDFVGGDQHKTINYYYADTPLLPADRQQRQNLIQIMRSSWISEVLHASVDTAVLLELDKQYQPKAVSRKRNITPQRAMNGKEPIPADKPIAQIFIDAGENLLILGEPGSGKTTTLLQLAEAWLEKALQDELVPVPVVVDLSDWGQFYQQASGKGQVYTLSRWLEEEALKTQFQMPSALTRRWLAERRLLLLLDGLDEVAEEARLSCLEAINQFKTNYFVGLAVCSRTADYAALQKTLNLGRAICLQPLTSGQIQGYLGDDPALANLREVLTYDETLQELATTPLFLSIMSLAYRDISADELDIKGDANGRLRHLYQRYIVAMFGLRPLQKDAPYNQTQAIHWLTCLAQKIQQHRQSTFYIDNMQPSWLKELNVYRISMGFIGASVIFVTTFLPIIITFYNDRLSLIAGMSSLSIIGFFSGFSFYKIQLKEALKWQRFSLQFIKDLFVDVVRAITRLPVALLLWSLSGIVVGSVLGVVFGLVLIAIGLKASATYWIVVQATCFAFFIFGLFNGLAGSLFDKLIISSEIPKSTSRNQGVRNSLNSMFKFSKLNALIVSLVGGSMLYLLSQYVFGVNLLLHQCLIAGLIFGWFRGLFHYGGETIIKHYLLRYLLAREGNLPPIGFGMSIHNLDAPFVNFLEAMTQRNILHRVGGGWKFIHQTLLEFFAEGDGLSDE